MKTREITLDLKYRGTPVRLHLTEYQDDIETTNFDSFRPRYEEQPFAPTQVFAGAGIYDRLMVPMTKVRQTFEMGIVGNMRLEGRIARVFIADTTNLNDGVIQPMTANEFCRSIGSTDCLEFDPDPSFKGMFQHDGQGNLKSNGLYEIAEGVECRWYLQSGDPTKPSTAKGINEGRKNDTVGSPSSVYHRIPR